MQGYLACDVGGSVRKEEWGGVSSRQSSAQQSAWLRAVHLLTTETNKQCQLVKNTASGTIVTQRYNRHLKGTEQVVAMEAIIATSDWVMGQVQLHITAGDKIQF